jgi:hypothetical protein
MAGVFGVRSEDEEAVENDGEYMLQQKMRIYAHQTINTAL